MNIYSVKKFILRSTGYPGSDACRYGLTGGFQNFDGTRILAARPIVADGLLTARNEYIQLIISYMADI